MSNGSSNSFEQEAYKKRMEAEGFEVLEPDAAGKDLLLDLDGGLDDFGKRLAMLDDLIVIMSAKAKPSKTPGHYHAIVRLAKPAPFVERQMYELMLGSDPCRAIHNMRHIADGTKHPILLSTTKGPWMEMVFKKAANLSCELEF